MIHNNWIRNIWAVGRNYGAHAKELGNSIPTSPLIFLKAGSCAIDTGQEVELPKWSKDVHHEVELALFFNDKLEVDRACAAVDLTARDVQEELKKKSHPWTLAKSFKGACLVGSFFQVKSLEELTTLELELKVNGVTKQKGPTSDMIFSPKVLIETVLDLFPVCSGDLLLTGTPAGVGPVKPGDFLEVGVTGRSIGRWSFKKSETNA
jgi:acylpyruvate hydrolase